MPEFLTDGTPYRLHIAGKRELYEVPIHSGNWRSYWNKAPLPKEVVAELKKQFVVKPTPLSQDQIIAQQEAVIAANEKKLLEQKVLLAAKPPVEPIKTGAVVSPVSSVPVKGVVIPKTKTAIQQSTASSAFASQLKKDKEVSVEA